MVFGKINLQQPYKFKLPSLPSAPDYWREFNKDFFFTEFTSTRQNVMCRVDYGYVDIVAYLRRFMNQTSD